MERSGAAHGTAADRVLEVRARTRRGGDPIRLVELTLDANPGAVRDVLREAFGLSDRRNVRQTGEGLVDTQRLRRQIDDTMRKEPLRFEDLSDRVYGLEPRIDGMKLRVAGAMADQREFLQSIAVGELQTQKQRLDVYTVQARFALAAIYDLAATEAGASP